MGLRSTLSSLLSAPVAAALEARVRQLVDAALDARDLADPAAVRDVSIEVERARRTTDEVRTELARVREALSSLGDAADTDDLALRVAALATQDDALTGAIEHLQARVQALGDLAAELRRAVEAVEVRAGVAPSAAPPAPVAAEVRVEAATERGCKVPGCTAEHRARGFCGRHYQMWKRGTLPGFVNADGTVLLDGEPGRWQVDPALAGEPAERAAKGLKVGGKKVGSQPLG
jgi:hypothetical protein